MMLQPTEPPGQGCQLISLKAMQVEAKVSPEDFPQQKYLSALAGVAQWIE